MENNSNTKNVIITTSLQTETVVSDENPPPSSHIFLTEVKTLQPTRNLKENNLLANNNPI